MAQYKVPGKHDKFRCPFDPDHEITAARMPYHLINCKKNYKHLKLAVCPFNARHYEPEHKMRAHMAECPDKIYLEQDLKFQSQKETGGTYFTGDCSVPAYDDWEVKPTENWDDDGMPRRKTWMLGQNVEEHFDSSVGSVEEERPMRLPETLPRVLQAPGPPHPLPGIGRGRGRPPPPPPTTQSPSGADRALPGRRLPDGGATGTKANGSGPPFSLSMAGVGRGRAVTAPPCSLSMAGVGRGRAVTASPTAISSGTISQSFMGERGRGATWGSQQATRSAEASFLVPNVNPAGLDKVST